MHILHIDTGNEMRGGQRQVLLLMRGLRDAGHTCELLTRRSSPLWEAAQVCTFAVSAANLFAVEKRSQAADLVHAHDARSHMLAAIASQRPFVVSRRVAFAVKHGPLSRWKYARARRYAAVSEFVAAQLVRAGVPREKIDVVYDGIASTPVSETFHRRNFTAVALATTDPNKGRVLTKRAAKLAQVPVVFSTDLAHDLPGASVFLYITQSEGLGSAALFAMSHGLPVIASNVGGLPEVVGDNECGLLVENDPGMIAAAISRLKDDPALTRRLGQNGRLRVEQRFTQEQMVKGTLACYRRALAT